MSTYEVTVPVTVTIVNGVVTEAKIDGGYPGFFSEASESGGVWDVDNEWWGGPAFAVGHAWSHVQEALS